MDRQLSLYQQLLMDHKFFDQRFSMNGDFLAKKKFSAMMEMLFRIRVCCNVCDKTYPLRSTTTHCQSHQFDLGASQLQGFLKNVDLLLSVHGLNDSESDVATITIHTQHDLYLKVSDHYDYLKRCLIGNDLETFRIMGNAIFSLKIRCDTCNKEFPLRSFDRHIGRFHSHSQVASEINKVPGNEQKSFSDSLKLLFGGMVAGATAMWNGLMRMVSRP